MIPSGHDLLHLFQHLRLEFLARHSPQDLDASNETKSGLQLLPLPLPLDLDLEALCRCLASAACSSFALIQSCSYTESLSLTTPDSRLDLQFELPARISKS